MRVTVTAAIELDVNPGFLAGAGDCNIEAAAEAESWVRTMCAIYGDKLTILDIDVEEDSCR